MWKRLHSRQQGAGYEVCLVSDAVLNGPASPACNVKRLNRGDELYSRKSGLAALFRGLGGNMAQEMQRGVITR